MENCHNFRIPEPNGTNEVSLAVVFNIAHVSFEIKTSGVASRDFSVINNKIIRDSGLNSIE